MKSFRITGDDWYCAGEDAIYYQNDEYSIIRGNYIDGFAVGLPKKVPTIDDEDYTCLYPSLEVKNVTH